MVIHFDTETQAIDHLRKSDFRRLSNGYWLSPARTVNMADKVGTIKVGDAREYGREGGFVVEQLTYGNDTEPHWCVPGWVEDRWGETGFFDTEAEARAFIELATA